MKTAPELPEGYRYLQPHSGRQPSGAPFLPALQAQVYQAGQLNRKAHR